MYSGGSSLSIVRSITSCGIWFRFSKVRSGNNAGALGHVGGSGDETAAGVVLSGPVDECFTLASFALTKVRACLDGAMPADRAGDIEADDEAAVVALAGFGD